MKKCFVLIFCFILTACETSHTPISIQQVAEVLKADHTPSLPNKWGIDSVQKYDDGFISPSITIKYSNGVTVLLTNSHWDLSKEFKNNDQVEVGEKRIQHFYDAKEDAYVFDLGSINYAIESPKHLRSETEEVIGDLLKTTLH